MEVATYPYYDGKGGLDFEGMKKAIKDAPSGSIFLLHACAHNPTGIDPSAEQWKVSPFFFSLIISHHWQELSQVFATYGQFAVFDAAYQGFASGDISKDNVSLRQFIDDGHQVVACQSFAKNMGLYGERAGAVHFVVENEHKKKEIFSQLQTLVRPMYSNPPIHGAKVPVCSFFSSNFPVHSPPPQPLFIRDILSFDTLPHFQIVTTILNDSKLYSEWEKDVKGMADRIISVREALVRELAAAGSTRDWSFITSQIGMFCYSGLSPEQCDELRTQYSIYMTRNGKFTSLFPSGSLPPSPSLLGSFRSFFIPFPFISLLSFSNRKNLDGWCHQRKCEVHCSSHA